MRSEPPHHNPHTPNLDTIDKEQRSLEYVEFLKYVAQSTGVINYAQLLILYPAICQAAMEWMLTKNRSVDFGFVVLHPCPHRANWKQMMVAMFPALGTALLGKSRLIKESLLTSTGFDTKLLSGELLAIASERYVVWGIETEVKRSWWKAMFRNEGAKLSAFGSVNYAANTARQIVNLRPRLTRAYLSFLRQIAHPCAKIKHSRVYGRGFIVPFVPKGRVHAVAVDNVPVTAVVVRDPEKLAVPSLKDVVSPDAGLPSVPDLQPPETDLRFPGGPPSPQL